MVSYGSNAEVQKLAFGATDSNQDTRCAAARDVATSVINSRLNYTTDLSTVPDVITRTTNLMAAGIILTGQINVDSGRWHPFYMEALELLKQLGEEATSEDQDIYPSIHIEGFGRYENLDDDAEVIP
jgi:hypothetical protein